jgi:YbbR domain-containing protein
MVLKRNKEGKSIKNGRKTKMLFVLLGMSFLFWMLIKLSKEYTDVVQFSVSYSNLPEGKMLQEDPQKNIDIIIKTFGFNIVKYHINKRSINVDLNSLKRKKGLIYYQLSKDFLPQIQRQVAADVAVIAVKPDTLYFHLGISKTKNVKVLPDVDIQYLSGYNLLGNLTINPEFISISGPEVLIDSIEEIKTENITLTDVNAPILFNIPIVALDESSKVHYSVNEVTVSGAVEKFTEAKLQLPFKIKNLPTNYSITTFPDEVEVVFQIGLSDYNKINQNDFEISCDYNRTLKNGLNYLIPEVVSKPSMVTEIKIVPHQIEYLIKK